MTNEQFEAACKIKQEISALKNLKNTFTMWCKCIPISMTVEVKAEGMEGHRCSAMKFIPMVQQSPYMGSVDDASNAKIMEVIDELIKLKETELEEI